jgi:hypothetical protein
MGYKLDAISRPATIVAGSFKTNTPAQVGWLGWTREQIGWEKSGSESVTIFVSWFTGVLYFDP